MMEELQKWQSVNQCESALGLSNLILEFADSDGMIQGRSRKFNAKEMAERVSDVISRGYSANLLTREFGIRQQAVYLRSFETNRDTSI
jgi:hypothetical protein